jgi:hypothetical protein
MQVDYNNNNNKKNYNSVHNPIKKPVVDLYSYSSFVNSKNLSELKWIPMIAKSPLSGHGIDG